MIARADGRLCRSPSIVLIAGFFVRPLKREVPHRPPKPRRADRGVPVEPGDPAPPVARGHRRRARAPHPRLARARLRLGFSDETNFAQDTTTKQAYDLLVDGFGPGFNGPLLLVAEVPAGTDVDALDAVTEAVGADPGVAFVSPAHPNDPNNPTAVLWNVVPTTGPQDECDD